MIKALCLKVLKPKGKFLCYNILNFLDNIQLKPRAKAKGSSTVGEPDIVAVTIRCPSMFIY